MENVKFTKDNYWGHYEVRWGDRLIGRVEKVQLQKETSQWQDLYTAWRFTFSVGYDKIAGGRLLYSFTGDTRKQVTTQAVRRLENALARIEEEKAAAEAEQEEATCENCGGVVEADDNPVNPNTGDYEGCVWCREEEDDKQVANIKAVLKDLKHYGQARMAPGGDDYCEIVYGQHNTITNSGGYPEVEPVAGHTIYVSSDHSTYGFDPFTIGQKSHSKLWRIVKVNADGTRTYHYTAKQRTAKAVLIATAAGLDADDLFKGDPCEMYGKMRKLQDLIDAAKGGK